MRLVPLLALSLFTAPAAMAADGSVTIQKQGMFPTFAWVDGQPVGKIKKKKPVTKSLSEGWHEVWYAADDLGIVTLCHGLVQITSGATVSTLYRDRGCEGLTGGWPDGPSAFKGSEVTFRVDDAVDAWVSIDGGQSMALPDMPFSLNLAPGSHSFVLYNDVFGESVFDQGMVSLAPGQTLPVICTTAGCVGFDAPPVFIVELRDAPAIQIATPGVSINMNLGLGIQVNDGMGGGASIQVNDGMGGGASVEVNDGMGGGASIEVNDGMGGGASVEVNDGAGGGASIEIDVDIDIEE